MERITCRMEKTGSCVQLDRLSSHLHSCSNLRKPAEIRNILAVLAPGVDRDWLQEILSPAPWRLSLSGSLEDARRLFEIHRFDAVICRTRFGDKRWLDLLRVIQEMKSPPPLIVADRLADERLWAEVLDLGGHDVLALPFAEKEVLYALEMAIRCRGREVIAQQQLDSSHAALTAQ